MNTPRHQSDRDDRLASLLDEQRRVRRRRRLTGASTASVLVAALAAGFLWSLGPGQQSGPPKPAPVATGVHEQFPGVVEDKSRELAVVERVRGAQPRIIERALPRKLKVERITDVDLLIAMRRQGVSAGILRIGDRTEIALNTPDERGLFVFPDDSAE